MPTFRPKPTTVSPAIYQAVTSFLWRNYTVRGGDTVASGHELLKGREHLFRPFIPTYGTVAVPKAPTPEPEAPADDTGGE